MSGHSKWKNILHKKEKTDGQRAKIFTKIAREISVAVKEGGGDPNSNYKLKDILAKARANNVPNDNIKRVIEKASGADGVAYESITYEGYGCKGIAVIVEAMTDNKNRTASDVRHYFDKYGGNLGTSGSVAWMFDRLGVIVIENAGLDEDQLMLDALEAGASDVQIQDEVFEIYTQPEDFGAVSEALEGKKYAFLNAQVELVPQTSVTLDDPDDIKNITKMLELMEENEDILDIYHNWNE